MNPEKATSSAEKPANILVVDDTPANLQVLAGMLKDRGYKVRPVPSGKLALLAAQRDPPALILLDINMPEMNGYEVCEHLKADDKMMILESEGFPISLADEVYEERSVCLGAGDRLYLYSDGVPEAMNPAGDQFGDARLLEAIAQGRSKPLQENVADLLGEIMRWHGTERPQDDISILAVEVSVASDLADPKPRN